MMRSAAGYVVAIIVLVALALVGSAQAACPVTLPNGKHPPGTQPSPNWYGNGQLFTPLWPDGVILADPRFINPDGSIGMKFPWWGIGVRGELFKISRPST
jgi:hypothetical protein